MNAPRFVFQSRLPRLINLKRWSLNDGLDLFFFHYLLVSLLSTVFCFCFSFFFRPEIDKRA